MDELAVVEQTDLREYLHILNRRKLVIALTVVVVLGLALAYSVVKTPIYSASATVLVPQQQATSALNIQNSQLPAAQSLQRSLSDEQQFAKGDAVKQAATSKLGYAASVGVGASSTADVLTFTGHSTDKATAAAIANAYANGYITARRTNQVAQYTQQVTALQTSIAQLQAKANALAPTDPQRAALQQSVTSLTQTVQQTQAAAQLVSQTGPTVVNGAVIPKSPTSPKPVRNGLLGLLVGLIIGVGLAFLVERLDDGINSRETAERAADGLPVVGLIPMVDAWRAKGSHHLALVEDPTSNVSEAYRTLRTAIQFLSIDEPKRVIGITSSVPGEGKTTAVANLAVSFARAGQRVIVVSCDLRRPRIHEILRRRQRHRPHLGPDRPNAVVGSGPSCGRRASAPNHAIGAGASEPGGNPFARPGPGTDRRVGREHGCPSARLPSGPPGDRRPAAFPTGRRHAGHRLRQVDIPPGPPPDGRDAPPSASPVLGTLKSPARGQSSTVYRWMAAMRTATATATTTTGITIAMGP